MSPRPARSEPSRGSVDAPGIAFAAVAIVLLLTYPLGVREAMRVAGDDGAVVAALFKLPPIAIQAALGWSFLATLREGHEPAISRFARIERGTLPPDLVAYTRQLTVAWGWLFVGLALVSAIVSLPALTFAWQWWTSVGAWACVGVLFLGERLYRKRRFPHHAHASLGRQLSVVIRHWRK